MLRPMTVALAGRHLALKRTAPLVSNSLLSHLSKTTTQFTPAAAAVTVRFLSDVNIPEAPTSNHAHAPLSNAKGKIVYTETDEAPALATYSLYLWFAKVCLDLCVCVCFICKWVVFCWRINRCMFLGEKKEKTAACLFFCFCLLLFGLLLLQKYLF